MLSVLFAIALAGNTYDVSLGCSNVMGRVLYPPNDTSKHRVIEVCTDYGPSQTRQIVTHELIHLCMHPHQHTYVTKEELKAHIEEQVYKEEQISVTLAPCLVESQSKFFKALAIHGVRIK